MMELEFVVLEAADADRRAIGASEIDEENPPVALLNRRVLLAHLGRAQAKAAGLVTADDKSGSRYRDLSAFGRTDLDLKR
jgi:hypothetical protein